MCSAEVQYEVWSWNLLTYSMGMLFTLGDDYGDMDFEEELKLEKRRQQLQRELSLLDDREGDETPRQNITIERKLKPVMKVSFIVHLGIIFFIVIFPWWWAAWE